VLYAPPARLPIVPPVLLEVTLKSMSTYVPGAEPKPSVWNWPVSDANDQPQMTSPYAVDTDPVMISQANNAILAKCTAFLLSCGFGLI
jgi:hypothetical protein